MRGRNLVAMVVATASLLLAAPARAWYFPEHVVLSGDGHAELAPEVRAIIGAAIAEARREGLALCERSDARLEDVVHDKPIATSMFRAETSVDCVPYAALSGLAGDHAATVTELQRALETSKGIEIVSAVAYEWRRFREDYARSPASIDRMAYVHELDVALYFVDTDYVTRARATRAHFHDTGRRFDRILLDLGATGRVDDVLSRFVFHHLRSLHLAARGGKGRVEALLEHAFAIHFLEDAFAAGHLVMNDDWWARGPGVVRPRHDAFDAAGLAVTRAMAREACAAPVMGSLEVAGQPPCWTTTGDGYLGAFPDATDRSHAAAAIARAEVAFAVALDPERVIAYSAALGEHERLAFAASLDPTPWWTLDGAARRKLPASAARAHRLVRGAAAATARLRDGSYGDGLAVDVKQRTGAVDASVVAGVLDPCAARDAVPPELLAFAGDAEGDDAPRVDDAGGACGPGRTLAIGTVGVSLLRPTLAQWPTAQADTSKLTTEGHRDEGWAVNVFASSGAMVLVPPSAPVDFFGPNLALTAGISYRFGNLLPGRKGRAAMEANVGISDGFHFASTGRAGGNAHVTMFHQELRWPVLWEILTTYSLPLDLARVHRAGYLLFFNGARVHEIISDGPPRFVGVEIEAAAVALSRGYGTHPLYAISPELRFYVGLADPSAAQPSFPSSIGPTFGISITGGYATFL